VNEGVAKDLVVAYHRFNVAAAQGLESARLNRDRAEKNMTSQKIAESQAMTRQFPGD
jgi:hypothetical protein